jgi:hypothetical protein
MNNGYAKLTVDGQEVGIKFGMYCITAMMDKEIPTDAASSAMYTAELIYQGYVNNCMVKREQPVLEFQLFYDLVEDSFLDTEKMKILNDVVQVFQDSKFVKAGKDALEKAGQELTKKKNGQAKKSKSSAMASSD